jgi:hypothetical protein
VNAVNPASVNVASKSVFIVDFLISRRALHQTRYGLFVAITSRMVQKVDWKDDTVNPHE